MQPFRPRLRGDLQVDRGDSVVFTDPLLRRRFDLGAIGDVLDRLDGRPVDEVTGGDARAESVLRTLLLLSMLEEPGAEERAVVTAYRAGAALPIHTRPDARFSCAGSGGCCQNHALGPLTDADVARVSALDLAPFELPGSFFEGHPRPGGQVDRFLRTRSDGRCVFLDAEARCGLHTRYGATVKPAFCQLFPLVGWTTARGVRVVDGGGCVSFPSSGRSGEHIAQQYAEAAASLPPMPVATPIVHLAPGAPCDLSFWLPAQDLLVEVVRAGTPGDTLRALAAALSSVTTALRRCEVTQDGPARALDVLRGPVDRWYDRPPASDEGRPALAGLAGALARIVAEPLTRGVPAPPYTRELATALIRVAEAAAGGPPLPPPAEGTGEMWKQAYQDRVFGQGLLVEGRPGAGLLRAALVWLVARAHPGGERAGHTLAVRRLDAPWPAVSQLLVRAEPQLHTLVDAASLM